MRSIAALLVTGVLAAACGGGGTAVEDDAGTAQSTADAADTAADEAAADTAASETADDAASDDAAADDAAADDGSTDDAAAEAVPSGEALSWTAATVDGGELDASQLAGTDVVLWMWAPWCGVCNAEAPEVAAALDSLPEDVRVIGVAGRDDVGPMQEFVARHELGGITHVVDADGSIWARYGVSYQPAWVFIDDDGSVAVNPGALGGEQLLETARELAEI